MTHLPARDFPHLRITCNHTGCHYVFEVPLTKVEAAMKKTEGCCPLCGNAFKSQKSGDGAAAIVDLAQAILVLEKMGPHVGVSFPVPMPRTPPA